MFIVFFIFIIYALIGFVLSAIIDKNFPLFFDDINMLLVFIFLWIAFLLVLSLKTIWKTIAGQYIDTQQSSFIDKMFE